MFERTELLLGKENIDRLKKSRVIIFGVGGVGGYVCESLARTGVGQITLVDFDKVSKTNINRQIIALQSTVGQFKVDVMKQRILDINPNCDVQVIKERYCEQNRLLFELDKYDYIADCIDSFYDKIDLIKNAKQNNIKIISAMGAGNKFGIPSFKVIDIFKTSYDALAKKIRKILRAEGIMNLDVVCAENTNETNTMQSGLHSSDNKKEIGSICYFPAMCGMVLSAKIIKGLVIFG